MEPVKPLATNGPFDSPSHYLASPVTNTWTFFLNNVAIATVVTFRDVWWNCLNIPSIVFTDHTWVHVFFWISFLYLLISSTKITSSWRSYEFLTLVQYKRMFTLFEKATKIFSLLFFQICIHIWMGPDFIHWLQPAVAKSSTLTWKGIRDNLF